MIARALAVMGTLLWACLVAPGATAAGEPARLGLTPMGQPGAYFELTLTPGERREAVVEAANFGNEAADGRTYAADVYSIVNGGFGAELYGVAPGATTQWLSWPTQHMRLKPREAVRLPVTISVPAGTPPGEYITALVIESSQPMQSGGPLALSQVTRSAIAVAITVPGPRQPVLAIGGVAHRIVAGHSILAFDVSNSGNVHLRPAGSFSLRQSDGSLVEASAVTMDTVYASTTTALEAALIEPLPPGEYCAELSLTDGATGAHAESDCLAFSVAAASETAAPTKDAAVPLPGMLPSTSALARTASGILLMIGGTFVVAALLLAAWRRRRETRAATTIREAHS